MSGMNFWDGLDAKPIQNPAGTTQEDVSLSDGERQDPTIGNRVASGGKAVIAGAAGAIPDTARSTCL